jgi:polyhydroxyalkanoate synthesis regulator phasin
VNPETLRMSQGAPHPLSSKTGRRRAETLRSSPMSELTDRIDALATRLRTLQQSL